MTTDTPVQPPHRDGSARRPRAGPAGARGRRAQEG